VFKAGNTTVCTGVTMNDGSVVCVMNAANTLTTILKGSVTATFAGNALWQPATGTAGLAH